MASYFFLLGRPGELPPGDLQPHGGEPLPTAVASLGPSRPCPDLPDGVVPALPGPDFPGAVSYRVVGDPVALLQHHAQGFAGLCLELKG